MVAYVLALALFQGPNLATPSDTVRSFVEAFGRADLKTASMCVEKGVYEDAAQRFERLLKSSPAIKPPFATLQSVKEVTLVGDDATVETAATFMGQGGKPETFKLHRSDGHWRFFYSGADIQEFQRASGAGEMPIFRVFVAGFGEPAILNAIVYPVEAQARRAKANTERLQAMKKVATAVIIAASDRNDRFVRSQTELVKVAKTYARVDAKTHSLVVGVNGVQWQFNKNLHNVPMSSIPEPGTTVMISEQIGGKLGFAYSNRALVAMADGSVRFVTPEAAAKLVWKPKR